MKKIVLFLSAFVVSFSTLMAKSFFYHSTQRMNFWQEEKKMDHETMTPEMLLTMARLGSYSISSNGKEVLYSVTFPSIKANSSVSKIYLQNIATGQKTEIATQLKHVSSPTFVNNGERIALLASDKNGDIQLYTLQKDNTDIVPVSNVKGGIIGYLFSPDEKQLVYIKEVKYGEKASDIYPDLPEADGRVINDLMYKHWDEWVTTIPHPFLVKLSHEPFTAGKDLLEGEPYEAPMKPFADISDIAFSPDGSSIAYVSRKKTGLAYSLSTNSDIYLYDIASGKTKNLTEGMMGYDTHPVFSPDGKSLAFCSMERDGYESDLNRLFVLDLKTGNRTYLSQGFECNVESPRWSEDGKSLFFVSCVKAERDLFEISASTGKIRQITQGQNDYTGFDMAKGHMIASRHSMVEPADLYQVDIKRGKVSSITYLNKEVMEKIGPMRCEKRWMKTTTGEEMLVWVIYPKNFDKTKKYPSILYCQGGPQDPISQFWSYRWNPRIMAEHGYIVILPNRHGVPGFGKAWNEQISGDYGGQNMRDYMTAADEMKKEPFIDPDRMGCVGASYGGFSVYWLAGHHNKRFRCFIAHAGIFNLEAQYLETEEKWFANWDLGGAPWDKNNAVAQRTYATSPHKFVDKWDTPILVIHGERDYRILASQGMMAFDAARMRGIPTQMLIYPDENHWILKPQNAVLWQRTFFAWLDKWLKS